MRKTFMMVEGVKNPGIGGCFRILSEFRAELSFCGPCGKYICSVLWLKEEKNHIDQFTLLIIKINTLLCYHNNIRKFSITLSKKNKASKKNMKSIKHDLSYDQFWK